MSRGRTLLIAGTLIINAAPLGALIVGGPGLHVMVLPIVGLVLVITGAWLGGWVASGVALLMSFAHIAAVAVTLASLPGGQPPHPAVHLLGPILLGWLAAPPLLAVMLFCRLVYLVTHPPGFTSPPDRCARCDYDLRGTPLSSPSCPECGHSLPEQRRETRGNACEVQ